MEDEVPGEMQLCRSVSLLLTSGAFFILGGLLVAAFEDGNNILE